jgi:hypothetical protein
MQGGGVAARLGLGWIADRMKRPSRALALQAFAAAGLGTVLAALPAGSPIAALAAIAVGIGAVAAGWTGIALAEVARVTPPSHLSEATSGITLMGTSGYFAAPLGIAACVTIVGWTAPLLVVSALPAAVALAILPRLLRG